MQNLPVIVAAKRTPIGSFMGSMSNISAPKLAAASILACLTETKINPKLVNEVILGCVLSAGIGQAPARQAMIYANIPISTAALTINKMCGSGLMAVMLAYDQIKLSNHDVIIAGGMENMSQAPYLLKKARQGYRLGHNQIFDHMMLDGLEDVYEQGKPMGYFAEMTARKFEISRDMQDEYAALSMERALQAQQKGLFDLELISRDLIEGKANKDEAPDSEKLTKIAKLRSVFIENGTVTAGNSSSIADGAATIILMNPAKAKSNNITPLARILAHTTFSHEPQWFTTAPIDAIKKLLYKLNWQIADVDLFEINEAFAVVALVAIRELKIPIEKVNVNGGACALGHPIGSSGARILTTLIYALKQSGKKRGIAALCIGGGEAVALAIEICE
jgi:acetyl-CoA C-acetyltransferase